MNRAFELHIKIRWGRVFSEDAVSSDVPWEDWVSWFLPTFLSAPLFNVCEIWISLRRMGETLKGWLSLLRGIHLLEWWTCVQFGWRKKNDSNTEKPWQQFWKTESRLDCKFFWQGDVSFSYFIRKAPQLPEHKSNSGDTRLSWGNRTGRRCFPPPPAGVSKGRSLSMLLSLWTWDLHLVNLLFLEV